MANPQHVYHMQKLSKTYPGGKQVLKNIWLSFYHGAKIGIVGPNGAGKSTLMKIMAGHRQGVPGRGLGRRGRPRRLSAAGAAARPDKNVLENVMDGVAEKSPTWSTASTRLPPNYPDETADEMAKLQDKIDAADCGTSTTSSRWRWRRCAARRGDAASTNLSGGEKRRVALTRLLLQKPDILLLDEPTNHLDAESVAWLENHLEEYPGACILITHDRYFLDNVRSGSSSSIAASTSPTRAITRPSSRRRPSALEQEEREEEAAAHDPARARVDPPSAKARQTKSKARIANRPARRGRRTRRGRARRRS